MVCIHIKMHHVGPNVYDLRSLSFEDSIVVARSSLDKMVVTVINLSASVDGER